ncbi:PTS sugar transporter subunit IIA [Helcococcus kunzii]|uniref:PTS sugar transporter subunit IIA n=1 Tax=Helcococcus kunzii TaxID=40091 RepID=UPI001BB035CE|nr:PTS sugar transporter subunit IIA [Helcococcus kunzii]QUY64040.1 PTS sugar transporter subunit IIA [Helcococcus kunzii]
MEINKEFIQIVDDVNDWKEAIIIASNPLLKNGIISEEYQSKMISNIEEMGPYVVLSKDIAMPHARPEDGAYKSAISVLKINNRVKFDEEKNVNTIIALACSSDDDHIKTLQFISKTLSDSKNYEEFIKSNNVNQIYKILKGGNRK